MPKKTIPHEIKMRAIGEVLAGADRLTYIADKYDISPSHLSRAVSKIRRQHRWANASDKTGTEHSHQLQHEYFQEILQEMKSIRDQQQALYKKFENICSL